VTTVETVAWVRPPEPIRGLDHLGVQAPCIALYGQLLPGITNVTDRARYYSFHPWILWAFERRYKDHSLDEFRRVLRRAECLFALIAIRHARTVGDDDEGRHGKAMVGRDKLLRIDEVSVFALEEYAALEGSNRYFKNKLGGLGQYYFGPLRDLRVLDHSHQGPSYPPGYDRERGRGLAEAFESAVPGDAFFRVLEQPTATWEDLDGLTAFCPCGLRDNPAEHELLLDLFLARTAPFKGDNGATRRASLGLLLDLAGQAAHDPSYAFEGLLRGSAYSGALVDGTTWNVAAAHRRALRGWGTYQRNELLSIAVQGLFGAVLGAIIRDEAGTIHRAADAADIAVMLVASLGADLSLTLDVLVDRIRSELPSLSDWQDPSHELQRAWNLGSRGLNDDHLEAIASESISILLALLARGVDEYPYGDFELDPEYFDPGEIHLLSLRHAARGDWSGLTVEGWVRWLAVHWGVARHLRIALRKLRGERRDTFRIRPLEGELRVVEAPVPVFTTPRVGKSVQILRDLGLIDYDDGAVVLTARGLIELEACRVG